ncbi:MAG: twin-arginine translocase TatA/TatE family subunit [Candidatus Nezhaarchaeota archaeon]|nr:twin-arginine translocase TatA/TatE family subunit [Candidatus Nezhaarchaeota archaeon]
MGGYEWLIILFIILILFGAKKLPELARGLGEAVKEFRRASQGEVDEKRLSSMSEDKVIKLARELGINTEGKSREEIIKQIVEEVSKSRAR